MTNAAARYDGLADWYDEYNAAGAAEHTAELARLLGPGTGPCLDLGCGTGHYLRAVCDTGRTPVGLDYSSDQLRVAARQGHPLTRADAAALPFRDEVFPTVVLMWLSTDVTDFARVLHEARRVLRPGGVLVAYGAHPCFNSPAAEPRPDGAVVVHPAYATPGWHDSSPWWSPAGIRQRTGMRHLPLAALLNAFPEAGLTINHVAEPGDRPVPYALAIRAHR